jgi:hypothetical protein
MMKSAISRCLVATAGVTVLASPATADDIKLNYLELSAGAGYSTNPLLRSADGAGFANVSARAVHQWSGERTTAELIGYWEGTAYTNGYSPSNLVSARAQASRSLSERLDISGSAEFSADYAGQLSNRFVYAPEPGTPVTTPVIAQYPDLYVYNGRQYRLDADLGFAWKASERSRIRGDAGVNHVAFSNSKLNGYTLEYASAAYDRLLSPRTTVGAQITASRTDFSRSDDVTVIINPAATLSTHLSEEWTLSGSAGIMFSTLDNGSRRLGSSTDPSFSGTVCKQSKNTSVCATAARAVTTSAAAELASSTSFDLQWSARIDPRQSLQVSAGYERFDNTKGRQATLATQEYHAAATYSKLLNHRCSAGVEAGIRGFDIRGGGHHPDVSASAFLRYRLGDLG